MKPTLTQISSLNEVMNKTGYIQENYNLENSWENLKDSAMTIGQYKFALALIFNNKYRELDELLPKIGINKKICL